MELLVSVLQSMFCTCMEANVLITLGRSGWQWMCVIHGSIFAVPTDMTLALYSKASFL
jgi:hypothetical protein